MTHPDVSLAAVIGVPHESHGEEIKAFVILDKARDVTEDELVAWGKEQMAAYKYPRDRRVRRRAADDRHRQDPQARAGLTCARSSWCLGRDALMVAGCWTAQGLGYLEGSADDRRRHVGDHRPRRGRPRRGPGHRAGQRRGRARPSVPGPMKRHQPPPDPPLPHQERPWPVSSSTSCSSPRSSTRRARPCTARCPGSGSRGSTDVRQGKRFELEVDGEPTAGRLAEVARDGRDAAVQPGDRGLRGARRGARRR